MSESSKMVYPDAYPSGTVCFSLGHLVLSDALGAFILYQLHPLFGAAYILLCAVCLIVCLNYRCRFCWYFGKRCYAGLGKLAGVLFEPGEPAGFAKPGNLIPAAIFSFTVLLLPLLVILVIVLIGFSWLNLALLLSYLLVVVAPGFVLRKSLVCDHCKQGELGCPAYEGMQGKRKVDS
jgi:hypothetical protein